MTAPAVAAVTSGTDTFAGSGATIAVPSHAAGDLILVFVGVNEIVGETQPGTHITSSTEAAWNEIGGAECEYVPLAGTPSHMLYAHWAVAGTSGASTLAINRDAGSSTRGITYAVVIITGAKTSAPIDAFATACSSGASTTATIPAVTTSTKECLVFHVIEAFDASSADSLMSFSGWSDGSMTGFGELFDSGTTVGQDRTIAGSSGVLAVAGSTGAVTATCNLSRYFALMAVAIKPGRPSGILVGAVAL